jgi:GTP-binding protein
MDDPAARARAPELAAELAAEGAGRVFQISAAGREGLGPLLAEVARVLAEVPPPSEEAAVPVIRPLEADPESFRIQRVVGEDAFRVTGVRVERSAEMTDWDNDEAVARFQRILEAMGVVDRLRDLGATEGTLIRIGPFELEWED